MQINALELIPERRTRRWSCSCGALWLQFALSFIPCSRCEQCGTRLDAQPAGEADQMNLPRQEHYWKRRFNGETGEQLEDICLNCNALRPATPLDGASADGYLADGWNVVNPAG